MDYEITARSPKDVLENQIQDFVEMVLEGGEVRRQGLEHLVREAKCLVWLDVDVDGDLAGVSALKRPRPNYRSGVAAGSGTELSAKSYPFELGWVYVRPAYETRGHGGRLSEAVLSAAPEAGIFATSRIENAPMHRILERRGFERAGEPYPSGDGKRRLQLFVRPAGASTTP